MPAQGGPRSSNAALPARVARNFAPPACARQGRDFPIRRVACAANPRRGGRNPVRHTHCTGTEKISGGHGATQSLRVAPSLSRLSARRRRRVVERLGREVHRRDLRRLHRPLPRRASRVPGASPPRRGGPEDRGRATSRLTSVPVFPGGVGDGVHSAEAELLASRSVPPTGSSGVPPSAPPSASRFYKTHRSLRPRPVLGMLWTRERA